MLRTSSLALVAFLFAAPAYAQTQVGVVYDNVTLEIIMTVVPDRDSELDDPTYSPKGATQLKVDRPTWEKLTPLGAQQLVPGWKPPPQPVPKVKVLQ